MKQFSYVENGLVRSVATGVYFFRQKVGGTPHRFSLETTNLEDARTKHKLRLAVLQKAAATGNAGSNTLTLAEGLDRHLQELKARHELEGKSRDGIAAKTLESYEGAMKKLREHIPAEALARGLRKIELDDVRNWTRPILKKYSATYYNTCVIVLREVFRIGIKKAACLVNHADELEYASPAKKKLTLPTREQWTALVANIRANADPESLERREIVRAILAGYTGNVEANYEKAFCDHPEWKTKLGLDDKPTKAQWHKVYDLAHYVRHEELLSDRRGQESADLVEFLTYTGARISETTSLNFGNIDFAANWITFPVETVKGKTREKIIAINPALLPVLERCKQRAAKRGDNKVFGIASCNKAITNACSRLNFPHWSHHAFRHLFASNALISGGAPILVADALGHSDNGRTLLAKYAHVRANDAAAIVKSLNFGTPREVAAPALSAAQKETRAAQLRAELAALEAA